MAVTNIGVINHSATPDDEVKKWAAAVQQQMASDVAPVWQIPAPKLTLLPTSTTATPPGIDSWMIVVNDAQQRIGLGYHELFNGLPVGYVLVNFATSDGQTPSRVFSHEVIEMSVDPDMRRSQVINGQQYLVEVGDVLSFDAAGYDIDVGGVPVKVSGFGTPRYFNLPNGTGTAFSVGPIDPATGQHTDPVGGPLPAAAPASMGTMLCVLNNGLMQTVFPAALAAPPQFMTQPHGGSRRFRRMIPRQEWRDRIVPPSPPPPPQPPGGSGAQQPPDGSGATPTADNTVPLPVLHDEPRWAKPSIGIFALGLFALTLAVIGWAWWGTNYNPPEGVKAAFNLLIGAVIANATTVIGYYFGSSSGSAQKTALLASNPPNPPGSNPPNPPGG